MAYEAKILLTIELEGGILIKGEPEVKKYYLTKKDLFPKQTFKGDSGNKIVRSGKYVSYPYTNSVAKQKMTLCEEAYEYMTSSAMPQWYRSLKDWKKMTPTQRLELHLARICNSLNGKSFTYQIIED